jgi:TrmH family RNA methyltransferase
MQKYKPYKKGVDYSYSLGIFPTIELVTNKAELVEAVFVASNSEHSTGIQTLRRLCAAKSIQLEINDKMIARLAHTDNNYAIGVFKKFSSQLLAEASHLMLVNPDDAGNLGTIMRTMVAFEHYDLAIIRPAVDAFDPRVVRASMGAMFRQRLTYFDSIGDYLTAFPHHHLYPFLLETDMRLGKATFKHPYSLLFGNEGAGLPSSYKEVGTPVRIEQSNEVDSLNLAVATSVALYHAYTGKQ